MELRDPDSMAARVTGWMQDITFSLYLQKKSIWKWYALCKMERTMKNENELGQLKVKWNMIMKYGTERSRFNGCSCGRVNSGYYICIVFTKKMNVKMRCTLQNETNDEKWKWTMTVESENKTWEWKMELKYPDSMAARMAGWRVNSGYYIFIAFTKNWMWKWDALCKMKRMMRHENKQWQFKAKIKHQNERWNWKIQIQVMWVPPPPFSQLLFPTFDCLLLYYY